MRRLFWHLAFKLYNEREPSRTFEFFAIGFCGFMVVMYVVAVSLNPTPANTARLLVAAVIVGLGFAHRVVRLERKKGPNALHRKMIETRD